MREQDCKHLTFPGPYNGWSLEHSATLVFAQASSLNHIFSYYIIKEINVKQQEQNILLKDATTFSNTNYDF